MPLSCSQRVTSLMLCSVALLAGIAGSLQAPFYPKEAESKGVSQAQVGFVFAVYHFTIFTSSPIFGKNIEKIGIKLMVNVGVLVMGTCAIGFGLLDLVEDTSIFISLSYVIRAIEAVGHSCFKTAAFAMITKEFRDTVGFWYAALQGTFGVGLTLGPFVGGLLYDIGGFILPFSVTGILIVVTSVLSYLTLPVYGNETYNDIDDNAPRKGIRDILKVPDIFLQAVNTLGATISIGFLQATLRNHIDQFQLSDTLIGIT